MFRRPSRMTTLRKAAPAASGSGGASRTGRCVRPRSGGGRGWICALLLAPALTFWHPAQAADRLSVVLDWLVNPDQAPVFVAAPAPGRLDRQRYARFGGFLAANGMIGRAPGVDEIAIDSGGSP